MATVSSTAWDVFRIVAWVCIVGAVVDWCRGQRTVRDEHGRVKPAVAAVAIFAALFAFGLTTALVESVA